MGRHLRGLPYPYDKELDAIALPKADASYNSYRGRAKM
jgi:hypothetical protein